IWQNRYLLLRTSVLTTAVVMGLRLLGMLQPIELEAFDRLMRHRPYEQPDQRLLIIQATPEDIRGQAEKPKHNASLSEETLVRLFEKLEQYQPVAIGLDIYRDFPVEPTHHELATYLQQEHLFGICKVRDSFAGDTEGIAPPPEISAERLSFSDAVADADGLIRRHLLSMKSTDPTDPCTAQNNLSFLLALYYLHQQGIHWEYNDKQELQFDAPDSNQKIVLRELRSLTGGYTKLDARGRQILLNYRSLPSPKSIAHTVSVSDLLQERIPAETKKELKHRLILVGIAGSINSSADYWLTPYSASQPTHEKKIPGLFIQAHMISQILSAVLDNRPLLWVLPLWGETLWILSWSVVGGLIACQIHQPQRLVMSTGLALGTLYGVCYLFILQGGWMPLIPSVIVLILNGGGITLVKLSLNRAQQ
ncbi:MAG: CHASE2 domain-containing protein, partial [Prochloraceae cyanobacterium]